MKSNLFTVAQCTLIFLSNLALAEVPLIDNPLKPPVYRAMEVEEVWRVGDNENEDFIFGVIVDVLRDKDGNVYLLDNQLQEVFKFSPDGEYLKSVSRKGEGPGELRGAFAFFFWDEKTIACFDYFSNQFVCFDLEGIPKSTIRPTPLVNHEGGRGPNLDRFVIRDGFFLASGNHFVFKEGQSSQIAFLSAFDEEANEVYNFNEQSSGYDWSKPITVNEEAEFNPYSRWCLGKKGEVYVAGKRTGYVLDVLDTEGNLKRKIQRKWPLTKRTSEEKDEAKNRYSFSTNGMDMPSISYKMSDYNATISSLFWHEDKLWVTTGSSINRREKEVNYVWDIFDAEGHLLEERTYHLPADPKEDEIHFLDDNYILVVTNTRSAWRASQDNSFQVQVGEGKEEVVLEDDWSLEAVLYRVSEIQK